VFSVFGIVTISLGVIAAVVAIIDAVLRLRDTGSARGLAITQLVVAALVLVSQAGLVALPVGASLLAVVLLVVTIVQLVTGSGRRRGSRGTTIAAVILTGLYVLSLFPVLGIGIDGLRF
jgi:hypothetical protein